MGKITTIVEEHQVERFTRAGWALVDRYQEIFGVTVSCTVPDPNGQCSYSTMPTDAPVQETRTRFVLERNDDSAEALLEVQLKDLKAEKEAIAEEKTKLVAEVGQLAEKLQRESDDRDKYKDQYEDLSQDFDELRKQIRKYEDAIGKIRNAIGTRQMDEILGDDE